MRILLETKVKGDYKEIMARFDRKLFEALAPKQGKMEIVEFTGSKKGDRVHIRFISPFKADWTSHITEDYEDEQQTYFVDQGEIMPFGLGYWKHRHIVRKIDSTHSMIVDDIEYKAKSSFMTPLLYPALYFAFSPRKKIYQEYFGT